MPGRRDQIVVREDQPQADHIDIGDDEDEPQGQQMPQQPQQPVPPPNMPQPGQYDQHFTYLFQQNEYMMGVMQHQMQMDAMMYQHQSDLTDDINAMAARLNIDERVRRPPNRPDFYMQPPQNPFQNDEEEDD